MASWIVSGFYNYILKHTKKIRGGIHIVNKQYTKFCSLDKQYQSKTQIIRFGGKKI